MLFNSCHFCYLGRPLAERGQADCPHLDPQYFANMSWIREQAVNVLSGSPTHLRAWLDSKLPQMEFKVTEYYRI